MQRDLIFFILLDKIPVRYHNFLLFPRPGKLFRFPNCLEKLLVNQSVTHVYNVKLLHCTYSGGASLGDKPQTSMTPEALISSRSFLRLEKLKANDISNKWMNENKDDHCSYRITQLKEAAVKLQAVYITLIIHVYLVCLCIFLCSSNT